MDTEALDATFADKSYSCARLFLGALEAGWHERIAEGLIPVHLTVAARESRVQQRHYVVGGA